MIKNPRLILPHLFSRLYHEIWNTQSLSSALNGFINDTYILNQLGPNYFFSCFFFCSSNHLEQ